MIGFVKDVEPLLERGERDRIRVDERRIQQLVRGFSADWKKSIETLNHDVMQSFTNFKNGTAILQVSVASMLGLVPFVQCGYCSGLVAACLCALQYIVLMKLASDMLWVN